MSKTHRRKPTMSLRLRLPEQTGGPQSSKKGEHGYDRKSAKRELRRELTFTG